MLVLARKEKQWVHITDKAGNLLRICVYKIRGDHVGSVRLAFDDDAHNFDIQRPDRTQKVTNADTENL